ncbi:MAG: glycosyltransferase family 4 protein [bacterium]|nr:glycosyltransferase family 4 protein [bacterium]
MARTILIATGIFPPDIGGPATFTKLLLEELPKRGFKVIALSYGESQKGDPSNIRRVSRHIPKGLRHFIYFLKVWQLGRKADIIFAQDPVSAGLPAFLANKFLHRKFILKAVGDYAWEQGAQRFRVQDSIDDFQDTKKKYHWVVEGLKWIRSWVADGSDLVIVPSEYLKKIVVRWGVAPEKINVILNAVSPMISTSGKDLERGILGLQGTILVSVGRLVPWKGFDMLIKIVADLKNKFSDLHLFIIGDGPERANLESLINKLRIEKNAVLMGSLPKNELIKYLKASDVFVLNTGYEGLSHQIREAQALGLPVVTTDVGGNPEIVIHGQTGLLVPYNDYNALRRTLIDIISDESLRQRLGELARKKEMAYTHNMMINGYIEIWKNL